MLSWYTLCAAAHDSAQSWSLYPFHYNYSEHVCYAFCQLVCYLPKAYITIFRCCVCVGCTIYLPFLIKLGERHRVVFCWWKLNHNIGWYCISKCMIRTSSCFQSNVLYLAEVNPWCTCLAACSLVCPTHYLSRWKQDRLLVTLSLEPLVQVGLSKKF